MDSLSPHMLLNECSPQDCACLEIVRARIEQGTSYIQEDFRSLLEVLQCPPNYGDPFVVLLKSHLQGAPPRTPVKSDLTTLHLAEKLTRVQDWINQGDRDVQLAFKCLLCSRSVPHQNERTDQDFSGCLYEYLCGKFKPGTVNGPFQPKNPSTETKLSFELTSNEFGLIVGNLAGKPQALGQFAQRLAISKDDFYMDSNLRHLEHAKELVTRYLSQPDATRQKLIDALQKAGLDFVADTLSPGGK